MASNQYLIDGLTRHQIFLQRFAGQQANEAQEFLKGLLERTQARISAGTNTEFQMTRLIDLAQQIEQLIRDEMGEFQISFTEQLRDFAEYESDFVLRLMNGAIAMDTVSPAPAQIIAAITDRPLRLIQGRTTQSVTLNQLFNTFTASQAQQVGQIIRDGAVTGETVDNMRRQVSQVVNTRTRRESEAVIRTAVNHIGQTARQATYDANSDVLSGERFVATLDGKTTITCQSLDGTVYPLNQGPMPPLHYNCRSIKVPVVRPEFTVPGVEGERASMNGPVDDRTTYNSWLRRQPAAFQNEVLGEERAKLFRSGGLSLSKFTDSTGRVYTLDELRRLEPLAFERANL
ncbi:MAG: minor capsid protein [Pseudomonadales bacterium]|nr:minor capsid protein [Pseudomonadales bacterium]